ICNAFSQVSQEDIKAQLMDNIIIQLTKCSERLIEIPKRKKNLLKTASEHHFLLSDKKSDKEPNRIEKLFETPYQLKNSDKKALEKIRELLEIFFLSPATNLQILKSFC